MFLKLYIFVYFLNFTLLDMPIKLQVLKNGESDISRAVQIMATDTKNVS